MSDVGQTLIIGSLVRTSKYICSAVNTRVLNNSQFRFSSRSYITSSNEQLNTSNVFCVSE